jgi:hypothetical protein
MANEHRNRKPQTGVKIIRVIIAEHHFVFLAIALLIYPFISLIKIIRSGIFFHNIEDYSPITNRLECYSLIDIGSQ